MNFEKNAKRMQSDVKRPPMRVERKTLTEAELKQISGGGNRFSNVT